MCIKRLLSITKQKVTVAKDLKITILTIKARIKKFQSTKDVRNLPGRGRVPILS